MFFEPENSFFSFSFPFFLNKVKKEHAKVRFSHGWLSAVPGYFPPFTFTGEVEKLGVRLEMALRQVKTILSGLRSEEMEKERSTRGNKCRLM